MGPGYAASALACTGALGDRGVGSGTLRSGFWPRRHWGRILEAGAPSPRSFTGALGKFLLGMLTRRQVMVAPFQWRRDPPLFFAAT